MTEQSRAGQEQSREGQEQSGAKWSSAGQSRPSPAAEMLGDVGTTKPIFCAALPHAMFCSSQGGAYSQRYLLGLSRCHLGVTVRFR